MTTYEKHANVKVSCPNEDMGCLWRGPLKELDDHGVECEKKILRNAVIDIQMLNGKLEQKDREMNYVKNTFALKVEGIAKEKARKKKTKLENVRTQTEKLCETILTQMGEVKDDNVRKTEEIENLRKEMEELKEAKYEEIEILKKTVEELRDERNMDKQKFEKMRKEIENIGEIINGQVKGVKEENVRKNEEIKILRKELEKLNEAKKGDDQKLTSEEFLDVKEVCSVNEELKKPINTSIIKGENTASSSTSVLSQLSNSMKKRSIKKTLSEAVPQLSQSSQSTKIFLDVAIAGKSIGRLVIDLFMDKAPKNCARFAKLCNNEMDESFKGSSVVFHHGKYCHFGFGLLVNSTEPSASHKPTTPTENKSGQYNEAGIVAFKDAHKFDLSYFKIQFEPALSDERRPSARSVVKGTPVIIGKMTPDSLAIVERIRNEPTYKKYGITVTERTISIADCGVFV